MCTLPTALPLPSSPHSPHPTPVPQAKSVGLARSGDKVVVSQCPRTGYSDVMEEAGVVKLITVDDVDLPG